MEVAQQVLTVTTRARVYLTKRASKFVYVHLRSREGDAKQRSVILATVRASVRHFYLAPDIVLLKTPSVMALSLAVTLATRLTSVVESVLTSIA